MSLLDRVYKVKRSGYFHRRWKTNYIKSLEMSSVHRQCSDTELSMNPMIATNLTHNSTNSIDDKAPSLSVHNNAEIYEYRNNWLEESAGAENKATHARTDDKEISNDKFREDLKVWALGFKIKQNALRELMQIVNARIPNVLPRDPRTLLATPGTITTIKQIGEGFYWHNGLRQCLLSACLVAADVVASLSTISLNIHIDGLPIYKSSRDEFWPILCNIAELTEIIKPMAIGIYCGKSKPSDVNTFLKPFVQDAKSILEEGLIINQKIINVRLRCFICDSPARAFVKGVANFNSKVGCQRCVIDGEYSHISHTTYFPRRKCESRNNTAFRNREYGSHHKYDSILLELPIDMVRDFVVGDSLHLIDLGIMKRMLVGWRDGKFGNNKGTKWSAKDSEEISQFLLTCKLPSEIYRAVRGLDVIAHWKGLEFRHFLLYISIVVLKKYLAYEVYKHFLMLFCAVTIYSIEAYTHLRDLAKILLEYYVEYFGDIYGEDYITSNVHNLIHLGEDVERFGCLSTISTYPFESMLYQIKNCIRSGHNPLVQVAKRMSELSTMSLNASENARKRQKLPAVLGKKLDDLEGDDAHFGKITLKNFMLERSEKNQWFLTQQCDVVNFDYAFEKGGEMVIHGKWLEYTENYFETPIASKVLNIHVANYHFGGERDYTLQDIKCKLVSIRENLGGKIIFLPLLHTL